MGFSLADRLPDYSPEKFMDAPPVYSANDALAEFNALTPAQKSKLATGMAVAASSDEADAQFKAASRTAAGAVYTIDTLFINMLMQLVMLEDAYEFVATNVLLRSEFITAVTGSKKLAINIAEYAESFDATVVAFCADQSLTIEQRKDKIENFIAQSKDIETEAKVMTEGFTRLKDNFSQFVGSFSTWARDREGNVNETIKKIYEDIARIDASLNSINISMTAISATLAATLPITGILALLFPPAAPFIIGAGSALAGIQLAALTGLAVARNSLQNEKRTNENRIRDLQNQITEIQAARTQLEQYGQTALLQFTDNVGVIATVWQKVVNDAQSIQSWLQDGANDADLPEYMEMSLNEGVAVYTTMGNYLMDYANGVTSMRLHLPNL